MKDLSFAIIGAGNGGQAMAACLSLSGFRDIALYDINEEVLSPVQEKGGIHVYGNIKEGFAPIKETTFDIEKAIQGKRVIMVTTTANAHEAVVKELMTLVTKDQVIIFSPGYLGSLIAHKIFKDNQFSWKGITAELMSLPYATRLIGPASVGIRGVKQKLFIAALPADLTDTVIDLLKPAFPQLIKAANVFEAALNNPNPVEHPAAVLFNLGRIESTEANKSFKFTEWISPTIRRICDRVDEERMSLLKVLGIRAISEKEFEEMCYGEQELVVVPQMGDIPTGSLSVPNRYITEDIPMGLVPLSWLGKKINIKTPVIDTLIQMASIVKEEDYWETGYTAKRLGIEGMEIDEILSFINYGEKP